MSGSDEVLKFDGNGFALLIIFVAQDIDIELLGKDFDGAEEVNSLYVLNEVNDIAAGLADVAKKRFMVVDGELGFIAVMADGANATPLRAGRAKVGKFIGVFDQVDLLDNAFDVKRCHGKPSVQRLMSVESPTNDAPMIEFSLRKVGKLTT